MFDLNLMRCYMSSKSIVSKIPFSVQQKFALYDDNRADLKQFLLTKSVEEREIYQEYLLSKRKNVKYVTVTCITANIALYVMEPIVGLIVLPFHIISLIYTIEKYDTFDKIQRVFDEVDVSFDMKSKQ